MGSREDMIGSNTYFELLDTIEILTHSGLKTLDKEIFKNVKRICRLSPAMINHAYSLILYQLKKQHSEIRYISFQMCIELFKRSLAFRKLLVKDLSTIMDLTTDVNPKKKAPPPASVADKLEALALSTIKKWSDEYGETFKELKRAVYYLKYSKKVKFGLVLAEMEIEEQKKRREKKQIEEKMKRLNQDIDDNEPEIENTILILKNCLSLLVPSLDDFFINEDKADSSNAISDNFKTGNICDSQTTLDPDTNTVNLRHFGITPNYSISVEQNPGNDKIKIIKTEENSSIIQNAEDNVKLIKNRFLPKLKKWNNACLTCPSGNEATVKRILKIKERMENCLKKFDELNILDNPCNQSNITDSDNDDDFEEVTKEGYESNVLPFEGFNTVGTKAKPAPTRKRTATEWKISAGEDDDPTSAASTIKRLKQINDYSAKPATATITSASNSLNNDTTSKDMTRKERLLSCAPKLPFDVDLYHWEDENLTAPTLVSKSMDSPKFWGTTSADDMNEIPNPEGVAALRTRVIEYSGKFEPVKWACRAQLPNGKLCPRKDRVKCPFHGKIVPRDEYGFSMAETAVSDDEDEKKEKKIKDPKLVELLEASKREESTRQNRKKRKSSKVKISRTHRLVNTCPSVVEEIEKLNFPGLTDIVGKRSTPRTRIGKKIFKRSAVNKVAQTMNKIDFAKHRDKFGEQFNYAISS